jgi:hypothetical protein
VNAVLIALIVACEVGFWCLLGAGLVARYVMRLPRTSAVLLAGAPVLDLVLLIASVLDLRSGSAAGAAHGLAASYIGFSGGSAPPPRGGPTSASPTAPLMARHPSGHPGTRVWPGLAPRRWCPVP